MSKIMNFNVPLSLMFIALFRSSTNTSSSNKSPFHDSTTTTYSSYLDDHLSMASLSPSSSLIETNSKKSTRPRKKIGNKIKKMIVSINTILFSSKHRTKTSTATTRANSTTSSVSSSFSTRRDAKRRSVRFSSVCEVVDEDSYPCGHEPLKPDDTTRLVYSVYPATNVEKNLEFRRHYMKIQKDFFREIDRVNNNDLLDDDPDDLFDLELNQIRASTL